MAEFTEVELLRIYCGESDRIDGRPAHEMLVDIARRHGAAGATVLRGVLGFGAGSLVHTAKLLRLSEDLPLVVDRLLRRKADKGGASITRVGDPFPGGDICKNCPLISFKKAGPEA